MPEASETLTPYEILIRFGGDGTPAGIHVVRIYRLMLDGALVKEELKPADPLDIEGFGTSDIMTEATHAAIAEVARLKAELDAANAALERAAFALEAATAHILASQSAVVEA